MEGFFFLLLHELICFTFVGLAFVMGYLINTLISPSGRCKKKLNNVAENRYTTYLYGFALVYVQRMEDVFWMWGCGCILQ